MNIWATTFNQRGFGPSFKEKKMYVEDFVYEPTLEELYRIYLNNNSGEKFGYHYKTGEPLLSFCEWRAEQQGYL